MGFPKSKIGNFRPLPGNFRPEPLPTYFRPWLSGFYAKVSYSFKSVWCSYPWIMPHVWIVGIVWKVHFFLWITHSLVWITSVIVYEFLNNSCPCIWITQFLWWRVHFLVWITNYLALLSPMRFVKQRNTSDQTRGEKTLILQDLFLR